MANELKIIFDSGRTITANVYQPDGTERGTNPHVMTEVGTTGVYLGTEAAIAAGDLIKYLDSEYGWIGDEVYQPSVTANMTQIAGNSVTDNSATLKLKTLNILNNEVGGVALSLRSTNGGVALFADGEYGIHAQGVSYGLLASATGDSSVGFSATGNGGKDFDAGEIDDIPSDVKTAVEAAGSHLALIKTQTDKITDQIIEPDEYIDTTTTPWQLVRHKKGDTGTEYSRKNIKTSADVNVTSSTQIPGKLTEPT